MNFVSGICVPERLANRDTIFVLGESTPLRTARRSVDCSQAAESWVEDWLDDHAAKGLGAHLYARTVRYSVVFFFFFFLLTLGINL